MKAESSKQSMRVIVLISLLSFVLITIISGKLFSKATFFEILENAVTDYKFRSRNISELVADGKIDSSNIMIIGIDEPSQKEENFGPFPWPNSVFADLIGYFNFSESYVKSVKTKLERKIAMLQSEEALQYLNPVIIREKYIEMLSKEISKYETLVRYIEKKRKTASIKEINETINQSILLDKPLSESELPGFLKQLKQEIEFLIKDINTLKTKTDNEIKLIYQSDELNKLKRKLSLLESEKRQKGIVEKISKGDISPYAIFIDVFFDYKKDTPFDYQDAMFLREIEEYHDMKDSAEKHNKFTSNMRKYLDELQRKSDKSFFNELKKNSEDKNNIVVDYWGNLGTDSISYPMNRDTARTRLALMKQFEINEENIDYDGYSEVNIAQMQNVIFPLEKVIKNVFGVGSATVFKDIEGKIRRVPLLIKYYDERIMEKPVYLPTADLMLVLKYYYKDIPQHKIRENIFNKIKIKLGDCVTLLDCRVPVITHKNIIRVYNPETGELKDVNEQERDTFIDKGWMDFTIKGLTEVTDYVVQDVRIPINEFGEVLVNYQGPHNSFKKIPLYVVSRRIGKGMSRNNWANYKNKILMVGFFTTTNIRERGKDYHLTPFGDMYGIEIRANTLHTIIKQDYIDELTRNNIRIVGMKLDFELLIMFIGAMICGLLFTRLSIIRGSLVVLVLMGLLFALSWFLFNNYSIDIPVVLTLTTMFISNLSIIIYRFLTEVREKRYIKDAFGQYLSPVVIEELVKNPEKLNLGGEEKVMTAFFSDIEKFSTISEKLKPRELVALLNDYLTRMSDIVIKYKGTIDKYEGDAIIAFWGAPLTDDEHALNACYTAIDAQHEMKMLAIHWKNQGIDDRLANMMTRIGINTGPMVVGNMGSSNRMDYTMMGDSVNLAARLEGVNKFYGTYNLISETTYEMVKDYVEARELDKIIVVGKEEAVTIYELVCRKGELPKNYVEGFKLFNEAMKAYRNRDFQTSIEYFNKVTEYIEKDPPSLCYIERIKFYLINPPPEDWNGVFKLTSKG